MKKGKYIPCLLSLYALFLMSIGVHAQCNPSIPSSATIVNSAMTIGSGSGQFWVCTSDTVVSLGGSNTFYVESNGSLKAGGGSLIVYLKSCAYFDNNSGSNIIYYEPGATIGTIASGTLIACSSILFNYSSAPSGSCDTTVCIVGINENPAVTAVNVYPNPASNVINVSYELLNTDNVSIVLTNALGQVVYSQAVTNNNVGRHTLKIDTDAFAAGLYQLNIKTDKKEHVQKVAVVK